MNVTQQSWKDYLPMFNTLQNPSFVANRVDWLFLLSQLNCLFFLKNGSRMVLNLSSLNKAKKVKL